MMQKINLVLLVVLSIAFLSHVYMDEFEADKALTTHWQSGYEYLIEQDIEYLKKRVTALESDY